MIYILNPIVSAAAALIDQQTNRKSTDRSLQIRCVHTYECVWFLEVAECGDSLRSKSHTKIPHLKNGRAQRKNNKGIIPYN